MAELLIYSRKVKLTIRLHFISYFLLKKFDKKGKLSNMLVVNIYMKRKGAIYDGQGS